MLMKCHKCDVYMIKKKYKVNYLPDYNHNEIQCEEVTDWIFTCPKCGFETIVGEDEI